MNKSLKTLLIWVGLLLLVVFAWNLVQDDRPVERRGYADFTADVEAERVVAVLMAEGHFDVDLDDGSRYSVEGYLHPEMVERLAEDEVFVDWKEKSSLLSSSLIVFCSLGAAPLVALIVVPSILGISLFSWILDAVLRLIP